MNALMYHFKDLPLFQTGELRPGLAHRIDKNTSGLLVVAKNEYALNRLGKQFFNRTTGRKYVALVWGTPDPEEGTITGMWAAISGTARLCRSSLMAARVSML